jgi:hypothetical protein
MPITRRLLAVGLLLGLAGCGSQTQGQQDRTDVTDLARALRQYNAAPVHSLAQQASACATARGQVQRVPPLNSHISGRYQKEAALINTARADALTGFSECAKAAADLDYPLMVQAQAKLAAANSDLAGARGKT